MPMIDLALQFYLDLGRIPCMRYCDDEMSTEKLLLAILLITEQLSLIC